MPKKFVGENSKAAVARARKDAVRKEQEVQKQKKIDDELWRDDDKHVVKKQQRKEDKDRKKHEQLEKKQTIKNLLEEETNSLKSCKAESAKLTRAQIIAQLDTDTKSQSGPKTLDEEPLVENLNRLSVDGDEASTVDEVIQILGNKPKEVDMHPEKRLKAAYLAFADENMERLKKEYPNMRLSQIKQLLRKEWMKSPDNPLNNL